MSGAGGDRYAIDGSWTVRAARRTAPARDRLTGQPVTIKAGGVREILRELRILLALPPGVGPRVRDALWTPAGELVIVMERWQGATLLELSAARAPEDLAGIFVAACESLARLHRAGFVHGDLKPAHLFLQERGRGVGLLDFGFALAAGEVGEPGGTPPFSAPEVARGWMLDARADQFSLAMIFARCFPALERDQRWGPVLARATESRPARRYPHILAPRDALLAALGRQPGDGDRASLGAGPLRGREGPLATVLTAVARDAAARVLVQTRPGLGLSRFLLECVAEIAGRGGAATRIADLPGLAGTEADTAWLEERLGSSEVLLVGIDDPTPALAWSGAAWRDRLGHRIDGRWARRRLEPLGATSLREMAAASLGSGGEVLERWADVAAREADGELVRAAVALEAALAAAGAREGLAWRLGEGPLPQVEPPGPGLEDAPAALHPVLILCARAGRHAPRQVLATLLERTASLGALEDLVDRGLLLGEAGSDSTTGARLQFATLRLWREARAAACPLETEIDLCLDETWEPEMADAAQVLAAAARAERLGARERAAALLERGLDAAWAAQDWGGLRTCCADPSDPPEGWDGAWARAQCAALAARTGGAWPATRLRMALGAALRAHGDPLGAVLLREVAEGPEEPWSVAALLLLADYARGPRERADFERLAGLLEERRAAGHAVAPGVVESFRAHLAWRDGRPDEAERLGERALGLLRGSGTPYESHTLQMLAVLRFAREPAAAVATLEEAEAAAGPAELRAQITHNLALMHARRGELEAAARCAGDALEQLRGRVRPSALAGLQLLRAWAWADLDRVDLAQREAHHLLGLATVRQVPSHQVAARLLLGFCLLHRSSAPRALGEALWAWEEVREARYVALRTGVMRALIDTLLDLGDAAALQEHAPRLEPPEGADPLDRLCAARVAALAAQAAGQDAEAVRALETRLELARSVSERAVSARYLHHLGLTLLAAGRAGRAGELFADELACLGNAGYGYHRAQALLGLAEARRARGDAEAAVEALDRAIDLARRIQSKGVLAAGLQRRAQVGVGEEPA